ncbi:secreted protein [Streptomyces viridochromogenes DSM 40736]|uniref:Secreted protein n=1 Tax=Streptomyces viridochromogenes (strain DSM 40736 / JCM 4977 / BCRC 1201 / Tue 494) TaxID=591159 RepID=D9X532_STRVT|nr:SCO2322 family protein [Streptomyces viridochromogenes]EFL31770.1 secreted protein [Streptomyces viridochromogenes DSM 40736]
MIRRAVLLLLAPLLLCAGAGQAQAAGYRYWAFWEREGDHWVYATQGPSTSRPSDGGVQGFRFAVSEDSADAARPRGEADFDTICAKTPARDGKKRVALLLDFGTAADAPPGETPPPTRTACAQTSPDATTAEALASVAKPLRYDTNALLCAIAGYPEKGCGEQVTKNQSPPRKHAKPDTGPSLGLWAGMAAVAALAAATTWQVRRRG